MHLLPAGSLPGDTTPKKRALRPQRVTSPSGGLLGTGGVALNGRKGNFIHVQLYDIGDAALLHENWPDHLEATAIIWQTEDGAHISRNHSQRWQAFLQSEDLSDTKLLHDFMMVGKIGPQPTYAKCLIIAGDSLQGLNLLENYFVWAFQQLDFLNTPNEVILHNATKYDLQDWISETALPKLTVGTAVYSGLPLTPLTLPDYRKTFLTLKMPEKDVYQLVLSGQMWRLRGRCSEWHSAYLDRITQGEVPKGTAGSEFVRFSEPFQADALSTWLDRLPPTVIYYELENGVQGFEDAFAAYPLLVPK